MKLPKTVQNIIRTYSVAECDAQLTRPWVPGQNLGAYKATQVALKARREDLLSFRAAPFKRDPKLPESPRLSEGF